MMRNVMFGLVGLSIALTAPAQAKTVFDTHREVSAPGGKTPLKLYAPNKHDRCVVAHRHVSASKLPMAVAPQADPADCATTVATLKSAEKRD